MIGAGGGRCGNGNVPGVLAPGSAPGYVRVLAALAVLAGMFTVACGNGGNSTPPVSISSHSPTVIASPTVPPLPTAPPGDPIFLPLGKGLALPALDYVPPDLVLLPARLDAMDGQMLRQEAAAALEAWLAAGQQLGFDIKVVSGFRSYQDQADDYANSVATLGQVETDRSVALPGHSEHQLGTTADLSVAGVGWDVVQAFGDTPEGSWLAQTAAGYGFVMSYPQDKEAITGYEYEPWHFRYVGTQRAQLVQADGLTLIEFLRHEAAAG